MRATLVAVALVFGMASSSHAQCRTVPLGISEQEFIRGYERRMAPTGAGEVAFFSVSSGQRMYMHLTPGGPRGQTHVISVDAPDNMVRQVSFFLRDNASEALAERIRIGVAHVVSRAGGLTDQEGKNAVDRAFRRVSGARATRTERAGEAAITIDRENGLVMISVGRVRC